MAGRPRRRARATRAARARRARRRSTPPSSGCSPSPSRRRRARRCSRSTSPPPGLSHAQRETLDRARCARWRRPGRAILVVEHDLRLVAAIADVVTVLDEGVRDRPRRTRRRDRRRDRPAGLPRGGGVIVVAPGEIVAVVGHDGGPARVADAVARAHTGRLGRVPAGRRVFGSLTVAENLAVGAYRDRDDKLARRRTARDRPRALPAPGRARRAARRHALGRRAAAARGRAGADGRARPADPRGAAAPASPRRRSTPSPTRSKGSPS